jgi:hypothetical protein
LIFIELCKNNGKLWILLNPPHPPLSPDYGGEDKGEGVFCKLPPYDVNACTKFRVSKRQGAVFIETAYG